MLFTRAKARAETPAPADWFTGNVFMRKVMDAKAPSEVRGVEVRFEPGARTNWHTHPRGQTLLIVSGKGRAQMQYGPVMELEPGDTVTFSPNERHWHGAAPDSEMVHIAIQEEGEDGQTTYWETPVSDEDYNG